MAYGILIDYEYCTGCHTCEVSCKAEHNRPDGHFGIKLAEIGPWQIDEERWQLKYVPCFTDECVFCPDRISKGKKPACVNNCYTGSMKFGPIEELAKDMNAKRKQVLFRP